MPSIFIVKYYRDIIKAQCCASCRSSPKYDSAVTQIRERDEYVKKGGSTVKVKFWHICHDHGEFVEHIRPKVVFACNSSMCKMNIVAWWHLLSQVQYVHFHDAQVRHLKVFRMNNRHKNRSVFSTC